MDGTIRSPSAICKTGLRGRRGFVGMIQLMQSWVLCVGDAVVPFFLGLHHMSALYQNYGGSARRYLFDFYTSGVVLRVLHLSLSLRLSHLGDHIPSLDCVERANGRR